MVRKLLMVAVAAVTVIAMVVPGCTPTTYNLTMGVDPAGAGTTTPTGTTAYASGTVVNITAVAVAALGYQFVNWTAAPAVTFADANAATTTFTMPAEDVTVTAHFVGPLDHFKCYFAEDTVGEPLGANVSLQDQFVDIDAKVQSVMIFANPAKKWHNDVLTPISNPDHHFTVYTIDYTEEPQTRLVEVDNQFGTQQLTVYGPVALAVPTQKGDHEAPLALDHFLLYEVIDGAALDVVVTLEDQFLGEPDASVYEPAYLANPVKKTHAGAVTEIENPEEHLVFYNIFIDDEYDVRQVQAVNQFGEQNLDVYAPALLAVPSTKTELELPPLGATIEFETWTINGEPVDPGIHFVLPDTIIDIEYKEHIEGPAGQVVTVYQTAWLLIHYVEGPEEVIWLHAVNADGAVFMDPPATKLYQMTTVEGVDAPWCTEIPLFKCVPVKLDVEIEWELEICTDYTKTINWLHFPEVNGAPILFDIPPSPPGTMFTLVSWARLELEGDAGPIIVDTDPCPMLTIVIAALP